MSSRISFSANVQWQWQSNVSFHCSSMEFFFVHICLCIKWSSFHSEDGTCVTPSTVSIDWLSYWYFIRMSEVECFPSVLLREWISISYGKIKIICCAKQKPKRNPIWWKNINFDVLNGWTGFAWNLHHQSNWIVAQVVGWSGLTFVWSQQQQQQQVIPWRVFEILLYGCVCCAWIPSNAWFVNRCQRHTR